MSHNNRQQHVVRFGLCFAAAIGRVSECFPSRPSLQAVGQDHSDLVADLLKELSNHNERSEERKGALVELLKITREDNMAVWDEHFKTILLLLLETLGDKDVRNPTSLPTSSRCVRVCVWMLIRDLWRH